MIKRLPPETLEYFLDMYNNIWEEEEIPNTWKHAIITPLLKEGKDVRSYRPVALTNIICKIFGKMIKKGQFGFREQRSTIDVILKITKKSRRTLENFL